MQIPNRKSLNSNKTNPEKFEPELRRIMKNLSEKSFKFSKTVHIPAIYGGNYGPDLKFVAEYHKMMIHEVIELHTAPLYCALNGFDPGFPLLIGLLKELITPRLDKPRLRVLGRSVAIGGAQTGVYSFDRPGGWRIIGRTPLSMFEINRDPQPLVGIGDQVKFFQISESTYHEIREKVTNGTEDYSKYYEKTN